MTEAMKGLVKASIRPHNRGRISSGGRKIFSAISLRSAPREKTRVTANNRRTPTLSSTAAASSTSAIWVNKALFSARCGPAGGSASTEAPGHDVDQQVAHAIPRASKSTTTSPLVGSDWRSARVPRRQLIRWLPCCTAAIATSPRKALAFLTGGAYPRPYRRTADGAPTQCGIQDAVVFGAEGDKSIAPVLADGHRAPFRTQRPASHCRLGY